jgi:23S rRNA (adenine2503-C2)-methyltransferase
MAAAREGPHGSVNVPATHRRLDLLDAPAGALEALLAELDPRPYRLQQVRHWLLRRLATGPEEMSDLPKPLRAALAERTVLSQPTVVEEQRAADGTVKVALAYADGAVVEAVAMPGEGRTTLCLSSQTGCAVGCTFCVTGALGAGRNLSGGEIFAQYRTLVRREGLLGSPLNVVFMGMGEPLLNPAGVGAALEFLAETVSPKRITVSTSGILPGLAWLAQLPRRPNLAVSLNATTQAQRAALMPTAARWPMEALLEALRRFPLERGRRITVEYVLIGGVNDTLADAARLPRLLAGIPVKVNLIPFNADATYLPHLAAPSEAQVDAFAGVLAAARLNVTVRWSRGREISGACGQLRGRRAPAPAAPGIVQLHGA